MPSELLPLSPCPNTQCCPQCWHWQHQYDLLATPNSKHLHPFTCRLNETQHGWINILHNVKENVVKNREKVLRQKCIKFLFFFVPQIWDTWKKKGVEISLLFLHSQPAANSICTRVYFSQPAPTRPTPDQPPAPKESSETGHRDGLQRYATSERGNNKASHETFTSTFLFFFLFFFLSLRIAKKKVCLCFRRHCVPIVFQTAACWHVSPPELPDADQKPPSPA